MNFFKSRKKTITDPLFGSMTYGSKDWQAEVDIEGETDRVAIWIDAAEEGPGTEHRQAFRNLITLLPLASEAIEGALYELYTPYLSFTDWEVPRPRSPEHLRKMLRLDAIAISSSKPPKLFYGFCGDVWPDASFYLEVDEGEIRPISLDD